MLKVEQIIAPRYMERFQCIGPECEDNCCTDEWKILVDKEHYKKIEKAFSNKHLPREEFTKKFKRLRGAGTNDVRYAEIIHNNGNRCGLMTKDGLCELHANYGSKILPDVCATYPKLYNIIRNRLEIYGTLSCPEVTRKCLLDDDALELVKIEPSEFRQNALSTNLSSIDEDNYYEKHIDDIRTIITELLSLPNYNYEQKMFFVIFFIIRINDHFHNKVTSDPANLLKDSIGYIKSQKGKNEVLSSIPQISTKIGPAMHLVLKLFQTNFVKASTSSTSPLNKFSSKILLSSLLSDLQPENQQETLKASLEQYNTVKKIISLEYKDNIEHYFTNYAINYWLGNCYTFSPDLVTHTRKLLLKLATIKFIFFSHPDIVNLSQSQDIKGKEKTLNETIVEVVYLFGRAFEHNQKRIDAMEEEIHKQNYGLPVLASLLKF